jgi:uncharacterized SAM-binding protein YcdF (DUF218 family)
MRQRYLYAITTATLIGTALFLFHRPVLQAAGDFLVVQDELHPVDVIHVISGPDYRTDYAIQLYQQGYARQIFFTGGWCKFHQLYHGQHGRELALAQGVPSEAIAIDESPVTSTYDEVVRLKAHIDESPSPIQSVIVVSDPFHMRRAQWTYQRVLGNGIEALMAPVPFEKTPFKKMWWSNRISQSYIKEEYLKFIYYIARYQISWGPIKGWLSSLDRN